MISKMDRVFENDHYRIKNVSGIQLSRFVCHMMVMFSGKYETFSVEDLNVD